MHLFAQGSKKHAKAGKNLRLELSGLWGNWGFLGDFREGDVGFWLKNGV